MGNCSSSLPLITDASAASPEIKDRGRDYQFFQFSDFSDESDKNQSDDEDLSPILLTPPQRSRALSAEVFQPPQCDFNSPLRREKAADAEGEMMKAAPKTTQGDAQDAIIRLKKSSPIDVFESKLKKTAPRLQKVTFKHGAKKQTSSVQTKRTRHRAKEKEQKARKDARNALAITFCFCTVALACIGWIGYKSIHSAREIVHPNAKFSVDDMKSAMIACASRPTLGHLEETSSPLDAAEVVVSPHLRAEMNRSKASKQPGAALTFATRQSTKNVESFLDNAHKLVLISKAVMKRTATVAMNVPRIHIRQTLEDVKPEEIFTYPGQYYNSKHSRTLNGARNYDKMTKLLGFIARCRKRLLNNAVLFPEFEVLI